jgi:hypothetical protein
MLQTSQMNLREVYRSAQKELELAGYTQQVAKLTQSELRTEIRLNTASSQYSVPLLINQPNNFNGTISPTEKRLNLQDAFLVSAFGVFLAVPASAAAASIGAYFLSSFPSLEQGFTYAEALAMTTLYNGFMLLNVSQNVLIPYWDLWKHWKVNQTQNVAAATLPLDQQDFTTDGFYPMEPSIIHVGSTNIQMSINLPGAISVLPALTTLIIIQRGILFQNVTSVTNN